MCFAREPERAFGTGRSTATRKIKVYQHAQNSHKNTQVTYRGGHVSGRKVWGEPDGRRQKSKAQENTHPRAEFFGFPRSLVPNADPRPSLRHTNPQFATQRRSIYSPVGFASVSCPISCSSTAIMRQPAEPRGSHMWKKGLHAELNPHHLTCAC